MTKQNPYERVERFGRRAVAWVDEWLFLLIYPLLLIAVTVVYPIFAMINGVIWYEALIPAWILMGLVGVVILWLLLYAGVRSLWITKKQEWERKNRG